MPVILPILNRSRKFGYIYWKSDIDEEVKKELKERRKVSVVFENKTLGVKNIDWENRRISIGWRITRALPSSKSEYKIILNKQGKLKITCL